MTVTVIDHDTDQIVDFGADPADEARSSAREWMAAGHTKGGEFTRPDARTSGFIGYTVAFGGKIEVYDFNADEVK